MAALFMSPSAETHSHRSQSLSTMLTGNFFFIKDIGTVADRNYRPSPTLPRLSYYQG
jgi:hypothetical protein